MIATKGLGGLSINDVIGLKDSVSQLLDESLLDLVEVTDHDSYMTVKISIIDAYYELEHTRKGLRVSGTVLHGVEAINMYQFLSDNEIFNNIRGEIITIKRQLNIYLLNKSKSLIKQTRRSVI